MGETGSPGLTDDFLADVGRKIRERRTRRSLTVQQLAERAQISRRLMTQIELGQANPSLVTVTRIARELGTEFTSLLDEEPAEVPVVVHAGGSHRLVWRSEGGSTAHLLEASSTRSTDLWLWSLEPGDGYRGDADPAGSEELFHVVAGTLTLAVDDRELPVPAGGSARLLSDRPYAYLNRGRQRVRFVRTVSLAR